MPNDTRSTIRRTRKAPAIPTGPASQTIPSATAMLRSKHGDAVPLKGVTATGRLAGLLFELTVEQRYENDTAQNLEAVFTFPLPLRAVLLGFELEIGERRLSAVAVARHEASERYERAIDQGDTAALIEHDGNGLYTVSLGNLMAGEIATIRYRYAELLDAHAGYVRINVPTVVAPRYGAPADAGLEGPTVPGVDLLAEYPFAIRIDLIGLTNLSALGSPSHDIEATAGEGGITVTLTRNGFLDRDFVLELEQAAVPQRALVAPDGDACVMLASATLETDRSDERPLALKILLDCSGSMGGDSIAAARRALLAILDRLTPADRLSLTRFGSSVEPVTEGLEPADAATLPTLAARVREIDADLGGTRMQEALQSVIALPAPNDRTTDVILITDGEIYDVERIVDLAAKSGHRLFAIAIGAAPNEALARALAEKTGGACEFVGPTEDAEAAILRTFKRLRATPRRLASVEWPVTPAWTAPLPGAVFPGDTLHLVAGFTERPAGRTTLSVSGSNGQPTVLSLDTAADLTTGDLLPRLAAARRLVSLDADAARELAVRYQLATAWTSFVVVAERADDEKATDLPATVAVPHMLAAGWGGSSSLLDSLGAESSMRLSASRVVESVIEEGPLNLALDPEEEARLRRLYNLDPFDGEATPLSDATLPEFSPAARQALLVSLLQAYQQGKPLPRTLEDLGREHPLPTGVRARLETICSTTGEPETDILAVFYALLSDDSATDGLDVDFLALLRGTVRADRRFRRLRATLLREVFA